MDEENNLLWDFVTIVVCLTVGIIISSVIIIAGCGNTENTCKVEAKPELVKEGTIVDFDYVGRVSTTVQFTFEDGTVIRAYELDGESRKNVRIGQTGKLYRVEDVPGQPYYGYTYTWIPEEEKTIQIKQKTGSKESLKQAVEAVNNVLNT